MLGGACLEVIVGGVREVLLLVGWGNLIGLGVRVSRLGGVWNLNLECKEEKLKGMGIDINSSTYIKYLRGEEFDDRFRNICVICKILKSKNINSQSFKLTSVECACVHSPKITHCC